MQERSASVHSISAHVSGYLCNKVLPSAFFCTVHLYRFRPSYYRCCPINPAVTVLTFGLMTIFCVNRVAGHLTS